MCFIKFILETNVFFLKFLYIELVLDDLKILIINWNALVRPSVSSSVRLVIFITYSNMTSFKRSESKPVVKIILIYDRLNLWRHRQFIAIFYQFLHIRIEIIHGSHMHILFLPRVGLYVSFLPLANAKGLPVVKQYIHMASMNYFLIYGIKFIFCTMSWYDMSMRIPIQFPKRISCNGVISPFPSS